MPDEKKPMVALYFWILEFDDVTCVRSIKPVSIPAHIFVLFYSDLSQHVTTAVDHMYLKKCHHVACYTWLQNHLQEGHG